MKKRDLKQLKLNKKLISSFEGSHLKGGHTSICSIKTQCNCPPLSDRCPKPTDHTCGCPPIDLDTIV